MRRYSMEITVGLIVLAIFILGLAIAWIVYIENPRKASEYRMNERRNMIELIKGIRPVTTATFVALPDYDCDTYDFTWNIQPVIQQAQATPQAEPEQPATDDEIKAWQSATEWVVASVAVNPDATQLVTGKEFGSGSGYDAAADVLKRKGWIMTVRGGRNAGAYVSDEIGTVKALLHKVALESAIKQVPRPAQRVTG